MMKKRLLWVALPVGIVLICLGIIIYQLFSYPMHSDRVIDATSGGSGAEYSYENVPWGDNLSVSMYSEATGKHYEENNRYKAAFYEIEEITIEKILDWLASCEPDDKFYQYVYSDPDSFDMFIYYSPVSGAAAYNSLKFFVSESTIFINMTKDKNAAGVNPAYDKNADYFLIRVQAPQRGVWPNKSVLFIDGRLIGRYAAEPD